MGKLLRLLTLACVVQGVGAQGLFKGFVPDENGTNLDDPQAVKAVAKANAPPGTVIKDCPQCPEMVVVPAGSFTMGSSLQEQALASSAGMQTNWTGRESPQHQVQMPSFAAGRYAVTKGEFAAFVRASGYQIESDKGRGCFVNTVGFFGGNKNEHGLVYNWSNVGFAQGDDHPVVCVNWSDTQAYIQWLNQTSGKSYRLLSEAEREYAARGGTQTAFWWGNKISTSQANYTGNDGNRLFNGSLKGEFRASTVPVNSFSANPFGLYNVHGNIKEWTQDCWHETYDGSPQDGSAWVTGCTKMGRVLRGGGWTESAAWSRSASRSSLGGGTFSRFSHIGFRLARDL
jgi:formylglycine-generating enzyme required for sulfatase activity